MNFKMLTSNEAVKAISTRDVLSKEAYQEMSGYYRAVGKSPAIQLDHHRRDVVLDELERECSRKVQD